MIFWNPASLKYNDIISLRDRLRSWFDRGMELAPARLVFPSLRLMLFTVASRASLSFARGVGTGFGSRNFAHTVERSKGAVESTIS